MMLYKIFALYGSASRHFAYFTGNCNVWKIFFYIYTNARTASERESVNKQNIYIHMATHIYTSESQVYLSLMPLSSMAKRTCTYVDIMSYFQKQLLQLTLSSHFYCCYKICLPLAKKIFFYISNKKQKKNKIQGTRGSFQREHERVHFRNIRQARIWWPNTKVAVDFAVCYTKGQTAASPSDQRRPTAIYYI